MSYEIKKTWSVLFRLYHWGLVLSTITLTVTGFYINNPWVNTMLEGGGEFPVASMRYLHFVVAYLFCSVIIARVFLLIFGNKQERILDFLPVTPRNIKDFFHEIQYHLYLAKKPNERLGHNALAGTVFVILYILGTLQILSGFFLLYPESASWQLWGTKVFGSQQHARYYHHIIMWCFIIFSSVHIYMVIWNDIKSGEGIISSIFTGNKFKKENKAG